MIKYKIAKLLEQAVKHAVEKELLPAVALPDIAVEHPQNLEHGDYASSLPLKLSRAMRKSPLAIAETLAGLMPVAEEIEKVTVVAPGFVNISLSRKWLARQVETVLTEKEAFGNLNSGAGQKVQLEYVSVNPTGPIHVGHGRGAILGSALASVLKAAGYTVESEYYVNDAGNQMDNFYLSLYARYRQALDLPYEMPDGGYMGDYVLDLAKEIAVEKGDVYASMTEDEAIAQIGKIGLDRMIIDIKSDLEALGIEFDVWFSERSLFDNGQYTRAMDILDKSNHTSEKEGAKWFTSTALGEDKDNVLVRSNGTPTYFASDVAYHYNKLVERGFDKVIDIWGADHQGHVSRMKAVLIALGIDEQRLHIIISQLVTLKRGNEIMRVSKRTGDLITLRELIEDVGPDVCRFFFLMRSADSQMDFDLELAVQQSNDNPVYYVQYAHARIASILRLAAEKSIDYAGGDVSLLTHDAELNYIRKMLQLSEIIDLIARTYEPHHLTYFAQEMATAFHSFYKQCRVITDDKKITAARLKLVAVAKIVFVKVLTLMGMNAPNTM
ncbi:arginine--tRNA ligase [Chloroflexota bacterium]